MYICICFYERLKYSMLPGKYKCNKCEPVYLTKEENIVIQGWFTSRLILNFLKLSMHHCISNLILEFSIFFSFFFLLTTNIRMENDTRREPLLNHLSIQPVLMTRIRLEERTLIERANESLWERITLGCKKNVKCCFTPEDTRDQC